MSSLPLLREFGRRHAENMILLALVFAVFLLLDVLVLAGRTPDTHREVTQHGDFSF